MGERRTHIAARPVGFTDFFAREVLVLGHGLVRVQPMSMPAMGNNPFIHSLHKRPFTFFEKK